MLRRGFFILLLFSVALFFAAAAARADFYSCKTPQGKTVLSSVKIAGKCRLIREVKKLAVPKKITTTTPAKQKKKPAAARAPRNFPKVDAATQKRRDLVRRQILADELAGEQRSAAQAEKLLRAHIAAGGSERRAEALKYKAMRHRENIAAITRELRRLR
jgi:hypothetical protein